MDSIVGKAICLQLNKIWQPIGFKTVGNAITDLMSGGNAPAYLGVDIVYAALPDGSPDFNTLEYYRPVAWDEWMTLPVRSYDLAIHTPKLAIRVPTVIISSSYSKMPKKEFKPTPDNIRKRDKDTCQITGRKLKKGEGNIDHLFPRSRGGKDTWENMVYVDKEINSEKGSKTLEEMGWKLLKKPSKPHGVPVSALIEMRHRDWRFFMLK